MHHDVLDLRNFYYRTPLGRVAQRAIRGRVVELWPDVGGQTVAGFGFAVPLLRPFLAQARRVVALMPAQQGVMPWPPGMGNVAVLCEETEWPLATGSVDRLVMLHGFETSDHQGELLEEAARVLAPAGRLLVVVPARSGLWARREGTPFGYGRPYSQGQLEAQLRRHAFTPERGVAALHAPPAQGRFWLRTADTWERLGRRFPLGLSAGVVMVEASRQVWQTTRGGGLGAAVRRPLRVLEGVAPPAAQPGRLAAR